MRLVSPLDRYVFGEFARIFLGTALGLPLLISVIDLTDNLDKYLDARVPGRDIALSYVFYMPESMFMVLPAAVLFATVFAIGAFTRHSEITAAKASGVSFYRLVMPILFGAALATGIDLVLGELMPETTRRRNELLAGETASFTANRYNFAYAGEYGRVYKVAELQTDSARIRALQIERNGSGADYPTYLLTATEATYDTLRHRWLLRDGQLTVVPDSGAPLSVSFQYGIERRLSERPADMMAKPRSPQEMRYAELTRFIVALERSGGDANTLRVERALKIAIPVTCIIIALFGAPLATSTQRGGAAYGIAISLATTVIFLVLIQLTKAIGNAGVIAPDLAAWVPGAVFGLFGLGLMARVRT
jgi:lipopolysaccharide export system permease protein